MLASDHPLRSGAAWVEALPLEVLTLRGVDPRDLLHKITTQALERLALGSHAPAAVLTPKGRVVAAGQVVLGPGADEAEFWTTPAAAVRAMPVLARYGMLLDVDVEVADPAAMVGQVVGPEALAFLAAHELPVPEPGKVARCARGTLLREDVGTTPAVWLRLDDASAVTSLPRASLQARETLRIVEGQPLEDVDFDETTLFNTTGLESHVSWSKGCYPGQEPVVMAKHRGHPPQHLVRLEGKGQVPAPGGTLHSGGRRVGLLTSVTPYGDGWRAIGQVAHAAANPGESLVIGGEDGPEATLLDRLGENTPQA